MKQFKKRIFLARTILRKLKPEQTSWTKLTKSVMRDAGTANTVYSMMKWLMQYGYITRPTKGIYEITEQGRDFLKSLPEFDAFSKENKRK